MEDAPRHKKSCDMRFDMINPTREIVMKKLHDEEKMQSRQRSQQSKLPTKTARLTPRQLHETYKTILTQHNNDGSLLRNANELKNLIDFLMSNRDIIGLSEDPIGRYPHYEFKLELEPDCPKGLCTQQYKQPRVYQEDIKKWAKKQLGEGLIEPSVSPFSSPLLVVPKKSGEIRVFVDYRQVNRHSVADRFPIPDIGETINSLGKAKIFSTLDLKDGFHHVQLAKNLDQF